MKLRLYAAFCSPPIFSIEENLGPVFYSNLSIGSKLKIDIEKWDQEYQSILDQDYPPNSVFSSRSAYENHCLKGQQLALELQNELGDEYLIEYWPATKDVCPKDTSS